MVHTENFRWHDVGLLAALEFCTFLSLAITWSQNIERSPNWWSKVSSKFSLVRLRQLLIHVPCLFMALFSSARMQQVYSGWSSGCDQMRTKTMKIREGAHPEITAICPLSSNFYHTRENIMPSLRAFLGFCLEKWIEYYSFSNDNKSKKMHRLLQVQVFLQK